MSLDELGSIHSVFVQRKVVRSMTETPSSAPSPGPPRPLDRKDLESRVLKTIASSKELDPSTLSVEQSFEEMGIDSLDGFEILFALEEEFDVNIPDDEAHAIGSPREMVERLAAVLASQPAGSV